MAFTIGAVLGLYPNGLWTALNSCFPWATHPPTRETSDEDVAAADGLLHLEIDEHPSLSSTKTPPPPSSLRFFQAWINPLKSEPTVASDSEDTCVESDDETADSKPSIPRNAGTISSFIHTVRSRSQFPQLRRNRGIRFLQEKDKPQQGDLAPLQTELAQLRRTLAQREAEYNSLQERVRSLLQANQGFEIALEKAGRTIAEKQSIILDGQQQLEREKHKRRELRLAYQKLLSGCLPSVTQAKISKAKPERRSSTNKPLDIRTQEDYEFKIENLQDRLHECVSQLEMVPARSPLDSPSAQRFRPVRRDKIQAPPMRYTASA